MVTMSVAGAVCADSVAEIHVVGWPLATETSATVTAASAVVVPVVISMLCVLLGAPAIRVAPRLSLERTIVGFGGRGGGGWVTVCCEFCESELEQAMGLARTHATNNAARLSRAGRRDMRCGENGRGRSGRAAATRRGRRRGTIVQNIRNARRNRQGWKNYYQSPSIETRIPFAY